MQHRFRMPAKLGTQLEELGISPRLTLRQAGLPLAMLDQEKIWMTTGERFAFYEALQHVSGDPAIGLKLGSEDRLERYSPTAIIAICSPTFRAALERMARYKRLTCPQDLRLLDNGEECSVQFVWLEAHEEEPPTLTDQCFSWLVSIGRRGTGRAIRPVRVEFTRPESHRQLYEQFFGCPVRFDSEVNQVFFKTQDIDRRFVTHNPDLLELVAPQLEAELQQQLEARALQSQLKGTLKMLLPGQKPRIEDAAQELGMSARTLQRRLQDEGVTFQHLVQEARQELSQHYLRHSHLDLNEIAHLVGYEEPNSFIRAFHKWEGKAPGEWRTAVRL